MTVVRPPYAELDAFERVEAIETIVARAFAYGVRLPFASKLAEAYAEAFDAYADAEIDSIEAADLPYAVYASAKASLRASKASGLLAIREAALLPAPIVTVPEPSGFPF